MDLFAAVGLCVHAISVAEEESRERPTYGSVNASGSSSFKQMIWNNPNPKTVAFILRQILAVAFTLILSAVEP
jgi:hypothetical protein